jgi:hypothetical protein
MHFPTSRKGKRNSYQSVKKSGFDAKRVTPGEYWANGVSPVLISAARRAIVRGRIAGTRAGRKPWATLDAMLTKA